MKALLPLARRAVLAGSGLVFISIGLAAVVAPREVAAQYGLTLDAASMNEFRAVFNGFWLSLGVMFLVAFRRPQERVLGDLLGLALAFQALGRLLSAALDGQPPASFLAAMAGELAAGLVVLAARGEKQPA